jgi:hypothetical protein
MGWRGAKSLAWSSASILRAAAMPMSSMMPTSHALDHPAGYKDLLGNPTA